MNVRGMFSLPMNMLAELFCNYIMPMALDGLQACLCITSMFNLCLFYFADGDSIMVCVWIVPQNDRERHNKYTVRINPYSTPDDLVYEVIRKRLVPQGE